MFDASNRYRVHPRVALRPEPFGALAYHYGTRRLTFLRSPLLTDVVRHLEEYASVDEALAERVPPTSVPAFRKALTALAESGFISAC